MENSDLITVCENCHMASCWQGIFMCDEARTSKTIELPVKQLREIGLESEDYWKEDLRVKRLAEE